MFGFNKNSALYNFFFFNFSIRLSKIYFLLKEISSSTFLFDSSKTFNYSIIRNFFFLDSNPFISFHSSKTFLKSVFKKVTLIRHILSIV